MGCRLRATNRSGSLTMAPASSEFIECRSTIHSTANRADQVSMRNIGEAAQRDAKVVGERGFVGAQPAVGPDLCERQIVDAIELIRIVADRMESGPTSGNGSAAA